jgi:hypothetical protein
MNLHNQIMNIQLDTNDFAYQEMTASEQYAYRLAHQDVRHAAAELSLEAEQRIKELEEAAREALKDLEYAEKSMMGGIRVTGAEKLREALGTPTQYIIRHTYTPGMYWSNEYGWVGRDGATRFSQRERDTLSLPIAGYWERL